MSVRPLVYIDSQCCQLQSTDDRHISVDHTRISVQLCVLRDGRLGVTELARRAGQSASDGQRDFKLTCMMDPHSVVICMADTHTHASCTVCFSGLRPTVFQLRQWWQIVDFHLAAAAAAAAAVR